MKSHRTFGFNSNLVETVFAFQHDGWGSPNIFSRRQLYLLLPESLRTPTTTRTRRRSPALPHVVHSPPVHILRVVQHTTMAFCVSTAAHTRVPTSTSRNVQSRKVTSTITRASLSEPTGVTRDDGASESSGINRRGLFAAAALATVAPASNLATPRPRFRRGDLKFHNLQGRGRQVCVQRPSELDAGGRRNQLRPPFHSPSRRVLPPRLPRHQRQCRGHRSGRGLPEDGIVRVTRRVRVRRRGWYDQTQTERRPETVLVCFGCEKRGREVHIRVHGGTAHGRLLPAPLFGRGHRL